VTAISFDDASADKFRSEVNQWLAASIPPDWLDHQRRDISEEERMRARRNWDQTVARGGFSGIGWPESVGGKGLGPIEEYIFYEESARAHAPELLNVIGFDLAGPAIIENGTEEQRNRFLPRILAGQDLWCEGFSEPDAGSDLASVRTTATPVEGGYRVTGQKIWTSSAQWADRCYLLVRTSLLAPKRHNLSVLLFDMRQQGVEIRPIRQITDEYQFNEVFFDDVFVPDTDRLGEENEGWRLGTLSGFRQGRGIFGGLSRYVQIRLAMDQFDQCSIELGRPLDDSMGREVELLRFHVMRCTELLASGRSIKEPVSIMRLLWSHLWQRITVAGEELGCLVHEGFWRREYLYARAMTIAGGSAQIQRNVIAERVLNLPR
jgi:alkylation response protein AidB-like acyl-CoA dehydrogenase